LVAKGPPRPDRILVADDGSAGSRAAVSTGIDLAHRLHSAVFLLRVLRRSQPLAARPDVGADVGFEAAYGPAPRMIADEAAERHCGLIVMGNRGAPEAAKVEKSISQQVARRAAVSLMIVKKH
jgi:nucleotide-binding universal stress UspA family protein